MQGETAAHAGFHSANAAMTQNEDQMAEATIGTLANLATATASDRGVVAALNQANSRLVKQLEETTSELRELKASFHQERRDRRGPRSFNASASNYCWTHGLATLATKRKPLGLITWAEVKPTMNDVSGRQL
jgi:hypothetical protein